MSVTDRADKHPPKHQGRREQRSVFASLASDKPARTVTVIGRRRSARDLYHWMLTAPWWLFGLISGGVYLAVNLLFALLFMQDVAGLSAQPGRSSFADAFFFSVETMGTIGYGVLYPKSLYANLLMTAENFVSLSLVAVGTGVIFARVSRPTARVMFSRQAVIALHDGVPTLMFRAANQRVNQILEAQVLVSAARQSQTAEGRTMRKLLELKPLRDRSPLFALTWTILIPLTEDSPLHGVSAEELENEQVEIVIVLSGVDETFAQRIHARHAYAPSAIAFGRQFADILYVGEDGRRVVDYDRFHDLEPLDG